MGYHAANDCHEHHHGGDTNDPATIDGGQMMQLEMESIEKIAPTRFSRGNQRQSGWVKYRLLSPILPKPDGCRDRLALIREGDLPASR